jgi:predicted transcriptional regulator
MALELSTDLILGVSALAVAAVAIYVFMRATGGTKSSQRGEPRTEPEPMKVSVDSSRRVQVPDLQRIAKRDQVSEARSKIRTLALQQEIVTMVMKRLFEAEDNGEISREEREHLSKGYEAEMNKISEELNRAELIVSLNELEEIRSDLVRQFQETLTDTQQKIDMIIGELHIEPSKPPEPEPEKPAPRPARRPRARPRPPPEEEEAEEEEEEEEEEALRARDTVEDRLNKLKEDVLKELEELDRLELEA